MGEGKPVSTPATPQTHSGSDTETHGANTSLDPNMQGGPVTPADRAAAEEITEQASAEHLSDADPGHEDAGR